MSVESTGHVPMQGPPQQHGVETLSPQSNPIAWSSAQPKGKLTGGQTVSDLTGASLKPHIRSNPQFLGQKQANLGGLGGNWSGAKGNLEGTGTQGTTGPKPKPPEEGPELILEDLGAPPQMDTGVHHADQGHGPQQPGAEQGAHLADENPGVNPPQGGQGGPHGVNPEDHHGEPQGEVRLRDTSGNPLDHVDQHDVDDARRDVDASVRLADQEAGRDKDSMSIKDRLKALWKSDLVKSIVFAAVATLALVAIVGLAAAIPFTGGGSAIALVGILFVTCLVFQAAVVGSVASLAAAGRGDPNAASFGNTYQKLQEEMKEKEADPTYKPSFADFYTNADVKSIVDGQDKNYQLLPDAQSRMDGLKQLQNKLTQLEAKIKDKEQERDVLERVSKRKIDENNIKLADLKQQVAARASLETELQECEEQLQAQYDMMNPQDVDLHLIDRLNEKIGSIQEQLASTAQLNEDNKAAIGNLETANTSLQSEIDTMKQQYNAQIDPMKQQAKLDKDAIDTQFKQFLKDFDSLDKVITQKPPEPQPNT